MRDFTQTGCRDVPDSRGVRSNAMHTLWSCGSRRAF